MELIMLKRLLKALGKMPCTLIILAGVAVLSVISGAGASGVYAGYSYDPATEPSAAVVLRAAKDGVYPWGSTKSSEEEAFESVLAGLGSIPSGPSETPGVPESLLDEENDLSSEQQALLAQLTGNASAEESIFQPEPLPEETAVPATAAQDLQESLPDAVEETAGSPSVAPEDTQTDTQEAEADTAEENVPDEDTASEAVSDETEGTADVQPAVRPARIKGKRAMLEQAASERTGSAAAMMDTVLALTGAEADEAEYAEEAGPADPETEEQAENEEDVNPTYVHADSMPEDVNSPVMGAVDYGNASRSYLSAADTVYNTDVEGLFAENGDYYRFREVNDAYFTDALIIGDSRTVGLRDYGGMRNVASVIAKESLNIHNLFTKNLELTDPDGHYEITTLLDLLLSRQYRKVYLSVGINELGIGDTVYFYNAYRQALGVIRQLQPDAIIYIQGIMHVSGSKSRSDPVFNNTIIVQRNRAIATLANGHDIFYLDMNPDFCDEDGNVLENITGDGVHLKASAYEKWHSFLLTHGIVRSADDYLGTGPVMEGVKIPGVTEPLTDDDPEQ